MAEPSKIDWADDDSDAPVENWADEASEDEKEAAPQPPRSVWGKPAQTIIPTPKVVGGEQEFPSLGAEPARGSRQPARGGRGGASAAPRGGDSFGSGGGRGGGDRYGDREGGRGGYGDRPPRRDDRDDYGSYGGGRGGGDRYEREGGRGGYDDREGGRGGYGDREGGRGGYGDREGRGGYDRGDREGGRGGYDRPPREQRAPPVIPEEGPWTAFVGNLNFKVEAPELEEFFINAGCNLPREGAVRMTRDRETDRPRGIAYVDFEDAESLRKAIELDGEEFAGRAIRLDVAENKRWSQGWWRIRYDATGDDSNWRDLAKKAAEERAAAAPVERERDREPRRDDRPDRRDRRDDRDFHRGDRGDRGGRPAPREREPLPAPTEEEEREREERKKALEEKRKQAAAANPFGDARPRDELAAQRKLQELEEKLKKQKEEEEEKKKKAAEEELKKKVAEEEQKKAAAPAPAAAAAKTDDKWRRDASSTGAKGAKPAGGRGGFDWKDKGAWNADKGAKRPETGGRGRGGDRREGGRGEGPRRGESSGSSSWGRGESPKRGEGRGPTESRGPVRKEAPAPAPAPAKAAAPAKAKQPAKEEKPKDNSPANAFDLLGEAEA
ncbi:RNA recognition motif domain containing protein [Acanthamoeba castellanii str. Neff]|uniref:RNA recognition motif domain containing protein n=1 Tax=Acanthamoeba castellanii (strain ATCC 30010 / Neff) TaxID=1257118 RepID=L8HKC8_ACACF|nr:RNA recognition motif domain containing protein [Acanthamoeba castellanii str. Neff]ELR25655.1 RNA recognition motif domain containing protein [Acanthamoeba castellanii str. Neff]